ncbi:class I SAM-dependent methyltransferase [Candidatus Harpocratesius sp.]
MLSEMDLEQAKKILGKEFASHADEIWTTIQSLHCPISAKILDIGTGEGKMAIILALLGYMVKTGEPSEDLWADWRTPAQKVGVIKQISFQPFEAENMPYDDNSFDLITAWATFHHIARVHKAIDECMRVLKPNGKLVIFEFNKKGIDRIKELYPNHPDLIDIRDYYHGNPDKISFEAKEEINVFIIQK